MRDEELEKLLRSAESDIAPVQVADDLASRVRSLDVQRRRSRRIFATIAPAIAAVCLLVLWRVQTAPHVPEVSAVAAHGVVESETIEQLTAQAAFHRRVALELVALREQDQVRLQERASWSEPEPADLVREQLEVVAYRMILRAEALRAAMRPDEEALAIYRDIVRLFPETSSARQAREVLSRLGQSDGAS